MNQKFVIYRSLEEALREPLAVQELHLYKYDKKKLDAAILSLVNLKRLKISFSEIEIIPAEIIQLAQLEEIEIIYSKLKNLPSEIGQLQNLKVLELHSNELQQIPVEIVNSSSLERLNIAQNKLKAVPEELGVMKSLKVLILKSNEELEYIPAELVNSSIEYLIVERKKFPEVLKPVSRDEVFSKFFEEDEIYLDLQYGSTEIVGRHIIGKINLPTGKVVFADPWLLDDYISIDRQIKPGLYDVTAITQDNEYGGEIKFVLISNNGQIPVRWESVWGCNAEGRQLGFPVDSALACFLDEKYAKVLLEEWSEKDNTEAKSHFDQQVLAKSFEENDGHFACHYFGDQKVADLYAFRTDDGGYPVFLGLDDGGKVISLLLDFHSSFLDHLVPWWSTKYNKPPRTYGLDFLEWIVSISDELKRSPLDRDSIELIESMALGKVPSDLALFYQVINPWGELENPRSLWEEVMSAHRSKKNTPLFPVDLKYKIVCEQIKADKYIVYDIESRTWGRDLRTYYLTNFVKIYHIHL
jgi:Protein of unknown function (DUF4241)/Leucine rich repeat